MAKRSSRQGFQKKKVNVRTESVPVEAKEKPAKLVWQMYESDLLLTFFPQLLTQEIQERDVHQKNREVSLRHPFAYAFHRIRNVETLPVESVQAFVKLIQSRWPEVREARVFGTRWIKERVQENRCRLIQEGLDHAFRANKNSSGPILQVFLTRPESAYVGVAPALSDELQDVGIESNHLGGVVQVPETQEPPSRAYLKLTEAMLLAKWSFQKGETVVDLAASPGGWTWVAAHGGAKVHAIDRAELAEELMAHPRVRFTRGDIFQFKPSPDTSWIICDVICDPDKSFEFMKRLLEAAPERMVWTLKFKGPVQFQILNLVDQALSEFSYLIRHLAANKNEVTVLVDSRQRK